MAVDSAPESHGAWANSASDRNCDMTHYLIRIGAPLLLTLVLLSASQVSGAQEPTLAQLLARTTDYVNELTDQLSGMVSEERYEQRSRELAAGGFGGRGDPPERRVIRSDYLLFQPEGAERYYGFRDVFEVNGRPVRDREERITRLFLDPSVSAARQVQGILTESARYNIGDVERSINTPTLALLFLGPAYKPRFKFERVTDTSPGLGVDEPEEVSDVWVIAYREAWPTTVISGEDGRNLPAQGRFWIEPATGRVLVSELIFEDSTVDAIITVRYGADKKVGHLVPVEMRERYSNRRRGSRVDGVATYTNFRRFQVQVEEAAPLRD